MKKLHKKLLAAQKEWAEDAEVKKALELLRIKHVDICAQHFPEMDSEKFEEFNKAYLEQCQDFDLEDLTSFDHFWFARNNI